MTQEHPIIPPPELIQQWLGEFFGCVVNGELSDSERYLATQAARWGADKELEACCEWLNREIGTGWGHGTKLRAVRRPDPPSLKEQALDELNFSFSRGYLKKEAVDAIRRALESMPD